MLIWWYWDSLEPVLMIFDLRMMQRAVSVAGSWVLHRWLCHQMLNRPDMSVVLLCASVALSSVCWAIPLSLSFSQRQDLKLFVFRVKETLKPVRVWEICKGQCSHIQNQCIYIIVWQQILYQFHLCSGKGSYSRSEYTSVQLQTNVQNWTTSIVLFKNWEWDFLNTNT